MLLSSFLLALVNSRVIDELERLQGLSNADYQKVQECIKVLKSNKEMK